MLKNCIIVHGCTSSPDDMTYNKHWMPWIKKQLENHNITTEIPTMPTPRQPVYENNKKIFEKLDINNNTILIWFSCWSAFLIRRLGESKKIVKKLILVAPRKIAEDKNPLKEIFYDFQVDKTIKDRIKNITFFTSDNEEVEGKESLKIFHEAIWWKIISLKNHWHYIFGNMLTVEFPELLKEILGK